MIMLKENFKLNYNEAKGLYLSLVNEAKSSRLPMTIQMDIIKNIRTLKTELAPVDQTVSSKIEAMRKLSSGIKGLQNEDLDSVLKKNEVQRQIDEINLEIANFIDDLTFGVELIKIDLEKIVDESTLNPGFLYGVEILL